MLRLITPLRALVVTTWLMTGVAMAQEQERPGPPQAWDRVNLRDGRLLTGSVAERDGGLVLRMPHGETSLEWEKIARVERRHDPLDELDRRRHEGHPSGTVQQRVAYGQLSLELGLRDEGRAVLLGVLDVDPDEATARALLGFVRHDGEWVTLDRLQIRLRPAAPVRLMAVVPQPGGRQNVLPHVEALPARREVVVMREVDRDRASGTRPLRVAGRRERLYLGITPFRRVIGANTSRRYTLGSQQLGRRHHGHHGHGSNHGHHGR